VSSTASSSTLNAMPISIGAGGTFASPSTASDSVMLCPT